MLPVPEAAKLRGAGPVSSKPYYDPEWWELERKAIFMRTWLHVGHVCEIPEPGSFIKREIEFARASLLIVRGKDGAVRAFHNVCTHRGTQLVAEAEGKKAQFSCPYHMWTYGSRRQAALRAGLRAVLCQERGLQPQAGLLRRHGGDDLHQLRSRAKGRPARIFRRHRRSAGDAARGPRHPFQRIHLRHGRQLEDRVRQLPGELSPQIRPPAQFSARS